MRDARAREGISGGRNAFAKAQGRKGAVRMEAWQPGGSGTPPLLTPPPPKPKGACPVPAPGPLHEPPPCLEPHSLSLSSGLAPSHLLAQLPLFSSGGPPAPPPPPTIPGEVRPSPALLPRQPLLHYLLAEALISASLWDASPGRVRGMPASFLTLHLQPGAQHRASEGQGIWPGLEGGLAWPRGRSCSSFWKVIV